VPVVRGAATLASVPHVTAIQRSVAVVGAGFLGRALAEHLGPAAILVSRSGTVRGGPVSGIPCVALDITDPQLDGAALAGCRALVIAVAPGRDADRRALYVEGTRRLLERAPASIERVVLIGSTSALPDVDGWVFEDDERWPHEERGRVQREAETVVLGQRIPAVVLRLGGLYGPGRELGRIYRLRGVAPLPGHGWSPTNLVHLRDAVQATAHALAAPAPLTGAIHVVDHDHVPRRQMYAALAERSGSPPPRFTAPIPADGVPRGKRVSNAEMLARLGVRLLVPTHH
jgi:nucleoside-diphosphate-sugar epimerase